MTYPNRSLTQYRRPMLPGVDHVTAIHGEHTG
jgi:hypothetical protein